jgi:hypothetical protein
VTILKDFLHVVVDSMDDKRVQHKKELHKAIKDLDCGERPTAGPEEPKEPVQQQKQVV